MNDSTIRAQFNPLIRPYLVLYGALIMVLTLVGIPLALVWVCGLGQWWARHYFEKLECVVGPTSLHFRKGILFQVEKTIPLENIQDVTFIEGPVLRQFHLSVLKFETAGQSMGQAHDMSLVGIVDAHAFRAVILERRQSARQALAQAPAAPAGGGGDEQLVLLRSIDARLAAIAEALRDRGG
jgi:membrane protein YdbS with pleckstrin-like domain